MTKTVYIVAGPTAVGKTAVSIELAKRLGTSVISADSRQCYEEMTIGTAKPLPAEMQGVRHYFIDEFPLTQALTAADYEKLSLQYLDEIFKDHDTAVVCGGTGLYIKALCEGLDNMPEINEQVAEEINEDYEQKGMDWLKESMLAEDEPFYNQADTNNPARLLRALIFKRSTGQSILNFQSGKKKERPFRIIKTGLELPREVLYERINKRVDQMLEQGFIEEAITLFPFRAVKNLQTVGYTELFAYLSNKCTLNEATEKIKQHTRNYAKRQMTWFRREEDMHWFNANDPDVVDKILQLQ